MVVAITVGLWLLPFFFNTKNNFPALFDSLDRTPLGRLRKPIVNYICIVVVVLNFFCRLSILRPEGKIMKGLKMQALHFNAFA
jgi:hypothetical protein